MSMQELRDVVARNHFVVLDTETTGLDRGSQVVQIAVIDQDGQVLVDTLVQPTIPIPADATAIHGINDAMVIGAPTFDVVAQQLEPLFLAHDLIIYNASYDLTVILESLRPNQSDRPKWIYSSLNGRLCVCAMTAYAEYWGDWNDYYQSYRWQRLSDACQQQQLPVVDSHNALGDCRMTLALVRKICAATKEEEGS